LGHDEQPSINGLADRDDRDLGRHLPCRFESVRTFLDSCHGRHFADDVLNELHASANLHDAIHAATQRWMGWTIGRLTSRQHGIPKGLPYLTGFVIHCEIVEESLAD